MRLRANILHFLVFVLAVKPVLAAWVVYEETNVKGSISGTIKRGSVIKMQSGSIYEVTGLTLQIVLELAPETLVLKDGDQFKLNIKGFDEPLVCKQLVPPGEARLVAQQGPRSTSPSEDTLFQDMPFDTLMPLAQQQLMGIQKLTLEEKELLRLHMLGLYRQGVRRGKEQKSEPSSVEAPRSTAAAIESQIDGDFEGWEGETIIKLTNGQIWQQTEYHYHYHYAFMPKVVVYSSGAGYKAKVDGVNQAVGVKQLK